MTDNQLQQANMIKHNIKTLEEKLKWLKLNINNFKSSYNHGLLWDDNTHIPIDLPVTEEVINFLEHLTCYYEQKIELLAEKFENL